MRKRLLSVILSVSLVLSEVPTSAIAEALDDVSTEEIPQVVVVEDMEESVVDEATEPEETPEEAPQEEAPVEEPLEEQQEETATEELPEPEAAEQEAPVDSSEEDPAPESTPEPTPQLAPDPVVPTPVETPDPEEPELTAQATLPKMDAAVTESNALAILKAYDPDGYNMVSFTAAQGVSSFSFWLMGARSNASGLDTAVHEECHGYSTAKTDGWAEAIYTGSGNYVAVDMSSSVTIFPTSEMASKIPASLRTFRYDTYVSTSSQTSSNLDGPYGLLNEFNAYSWGLNNQLRLFPYYRDYAVSSSPLDAFGDFLSNCNNDKNAYAEFRYWTLRYLAYAKSKHPEVYEHFLNDQQFLDAYCQTQLRFESLIAQIDQRVDEIISWGEKRGYEVWLEDGMLWASKDGSWSSRGKDTGDYDLLMAEIAKSEYQAIDDAIHSKARLYNISTAKVTSVSAKAYTGQAYKPKPKVTYEGKTLQNGTDYTISYKNNVNAGTATITITGKGSYYGTKKATFKITPISIDGATISKIANQKYDGTAKKPSPTVKVDGVTLKKDTDYTLSYKANNKPGTATATITGTGNYAGTRKVSFKIIEMAGTWKKSGSRWWYQWKDGKYPASVWLVIDGKTYRFDSSGWMLTGWQKVSGSWYWLGSDGAMRTGWLKQGGKWYWLKPSGAMATGWQQVSGKYYYFESSGAMVSSKWVGDYYLQADGSMATNKWIGKYHVDANGKWDQTK